MKIPVARWFFALLGCACVPVWGQALQLPEEFPIPMAFRPLESGDPIEKLAPFPIIHAGPIDKIKKRWPDKMCILHRPYAALHRRLVARGKAKVWPGHFLYWAGSKVTRDLAADGTATTVFVEYPNRFRTDTPNKLGVADDVVIYRLDENGRPDWSHCEYAIVSKIGADFIEVLRAQYGTKPLEFKAQRAVVATHAQYCGDNTGVRSWSLNFSLHCPQSPDGLTAAEWAAAYFADELKERVPEADGIEFDVGMWRHGLFRRPVDCNNDLTPDYGCMNGINSFGLGGQVFARELRRLLGPNKIIQVDSGGAAGGYRVWKYVNGIEMESFPSGSHFDRFSPAFEHLRHWCEKAEGVPQFSYGFTKIATTVFGDKYLDDGRKTNFRFRVGLASALMVGMPHPYAALGRGSERKGAETADTFGIFYWDEYRGGDLNDWHWLGRPLGPAKRYLDDLDDRNLLNSPAVKWELKCAEGCEAELIGGGEAKPPRGVRVTKLAEARPIDLFRVQLVSSRVPLRPGQEYTVSFRAKGTDSWKYMGHTFDGVPSLLSIHLSQRGNFSVLLDSEWRQYHISLTTNAKATAVRLRLGVGEQIGETHIQDIRLRRGGAERWVRDFERGKVLLNMTYRPWKVEIGEGYRYLHGEQDPDVNTGKTAAKVIEVPPCDARFLVKQQ